MKQVKTNALRILDKEKISYTIKPYDEQVTDGQEVAALLNENPSQVYKTLVTMGHSKSYYVFCIPVAEQLDLKACAKAVNEKSIEMLPMKQLLPLTGYIHGGCSPVGMKKSFPTILQQEAKQFSTIHVSAGKRGMQMEIAVDDLIRITKANTADVIRR